MYNLEFNPGPRPKDTDFGTDYYHSQNYEGYLDRETRYREIAGFMLGGLRGQNILSDGDPVVDFGCGPGMLCGGLHTQGHQWVTGYDFSPDAIQLARERYPHCTFTTSADVAFQTPARLTVALDVLEHIPMDALVHQLHTLNTDFLLVRIPLGHFDYGPWVSPVSANDPTHVNCFSRGTWKQILAMTGFREHSNVDQPYLWDSEITYVKLLQSQK